MFKEYYRIITIKTKAYQLQEEFQEQLPDFSKPRVHPKGSWLIENQDGTRYIVSDRFFNDNFSEIVEQKETSVEVLPEPQN